MLFRIDKRYPTGIVETDTIEMANVEAMTTWVRRVNANLNVPWDVLSWERALIHGGQGPKVTDILI